MIPTKNKKSIPDIFNSLKNEMNKDLKKTGRFFRNREIDVNFQFQYNLIPLSKIDGTTPSELNLEIRKIVLKK